MGFNDYGILVKSNKHRYCGKTSDIMSGIIGGTGYRRWSRGIRVSIRETVIPPSATSSP